MGSLTRFALWLLLFRLTQAGLVNVTVDDSSSDPRTGRSIIYSPASMWNTQAHCSSAVCNAKPNIDIVSSGTWHEATFDLSRTSEPITASFEFEGSAVYVYCVLATSLVFPSGDSDMSFSIDGQPVGTFVRSAPGPWGYQYNVPVFSHSGLSSGLHTLEIRNGDIGKDKGQSLLMLDHIVYSFDDQNAAATPATPTVVGPAPGSPPNDPGISSLPLSPAISGTTAGAPTTQSLSLSLSPSSGSPPSALPAIGSSNQFTSSPANPNSPPDPASSTNGAAAAPTDPNHSFDPSQPSGSPSPIPTSSTSTRGRIIGAVLGTALALLAIGLIICLVCRRRRRRARTAALRASSAMHAGRLLATDDGSSFASPPYGDPLASMQLPSPVQSRRTVTFGLGTTSPANSPTSPGGIEPFPLFGGGDAEANRRQACQRWTVASDSKRVLLETSMSPPPAYHDHN